MIRGERKYKLYGFTKTVGFPCICYGKNAYFFKIGWAKKYKCFKVYKGHITADEVVFNYVENYGKAFFGLIVAYTEKVEYDD